MYVGGTKEIREKLIYIYIVSSDLVTNTGIMSNSSIMLGEFRDVKVKRNSRWGWGRGLFLFPRQ